MAIARQHDAQMGKWLCIVGIGVAACFAAFIIDMFATSAGANFSDVDAIEGLATLRPPVFWSMAFLEWLPLIGVLAWLGLAAIDSLSRKAKIK